MAVDERRIGGEGVFARIRPTRVNLNDGNTGILKRN